MIKCQQIDPVSDEKERSGSFGAYKSYQRMLEKANENVLSFAMIETQQAVDNLDEILSVPNLTALLT